jgi:hypothetical protein
LELHEESRRAKHAAISARTKEEKKARRDAERVGMRVYWERHGPDAIGIYF